MTEPLRLVDAGAIASAHADDILELESQASAPYAAFVYREAGVARAIASALWQSGQAEFSPPGLLLALRGDRCIGMLASVSGRELRRRRLTGAMTLTRLGTGTLDDGVRHRIALASPTLMRVADDDAYLSRIAVSSEARGGGVASALVAAFVAAASASGNARCVLEVEVTNAAALALYGRHGFVEIDRRRADDPTSGASLEYLHLARRLAP